MVKICFYVLQLFALRKSQGQRAFGQGPGVLAKYMKIQLNLCLLDLMFTNYDLVVGGRVGLVVGARWGASGEDMHFSNLKNAFLLN